MNNSEIQMKHKLIEFRSVTSTTLHSINIRETKVEHTLLTYLQCFCLKRRAQD